MSLYLIANVDLKHNKMTLYNQNGLSSDSKEPAVIIHKDREEEICVFEELFDMTRALNVSIVVQYDLENGSIVPYTRGMN